jgi:hypothetical protein
MISLCIVVDASVGRAAGEPVSVHASSSRCRLFLQAMLDGNYKMALNNPIKIEWDKHQSNYAMTWRAAMARKGRIQRVSNNQSHDLRHAIQGFSLDRNIGEIMLKDAHLLEAAQASDQRVASLDETVRGHFRRLCKTFEEIGPILWTNPIKSSDESVDWLTRGAPDERDRRLKPF